MKEPFRKDAALLADIAAARGGPGFRLWWLGQSGFLLEWQGRHLLFDPYLSDSLTAKYAATDKPHVRMTGRVIAPESLDFIEVVTSSHNHTDHLDAATLLPLRAANPGLRLVIPEANREFAAARLGCDPAWPVGLDDGLEVDLDGWRIHGIAAAHESLDRDAAGRCLYLGYVVRFGPYAVYHSGDTVRYDGLAARLAPHAVDVAILPVNGARPERRVAGNLNGEEAARLARDTGARLLVPCHYDLFEFNTASPGECAAEAARLGQPCRVLRNGEGLFHE